MKLLEKWWAEYLVKVVKDDAPPEVTSELRKAFLAGVACFFRELIVEMEKPGKSKLLDVVADEITLFFNEELSQGND